MQNLRASWLPSMLIRRASGSSSKLTRPNLQQSLPSNLYHSINELKLNRFITCCCDHDLKVLIKHGHASDADLLRAWEIIYGEYSDASGNQTSKRLLKLTKDIAYHEAKLKAVAYCLDGLRHGPYKDYIYVLKELYGYNYSFDWSRPEQYARDIEAVAARLGSVKFTIQTKTVEYEREKKAVEGKPVTRESFNDILAVLCEHFHTVFDSEKITVAEYLSYRKRYEQQAEAMQQQSEQLKNKGYRHGS